MLTNLNWRIADQLAINKYDWEVELGCTETTRTRLYRWWHLDNCVDYQQDKMAGSELTDSFFSSRKLLAI